MAQENNPNLDKLFRDIVKRNFKDMPAENYNPDSLMKMVESLEPYLKDTVFLCYGLLDGKLRTQKMVGEELKITSQAVSLRLNRALQELGHTSKFTFILGKENPITLDTSLKDLRLSKRTTNCLIRAEITTVGKLLSYNKERLRNLRNIGSKSYEEILSLIDELYELSPDVRDEIDRKRNADMERKKSPGLETLVKDLGLSVRAYKCLVRAGINNVEDLLRCDENKLRKLRNLGAKTAEEILIVMKKYRDLLGIPEENISQEKISPEDSLEIKPSEVSELEMLKNQKRELTYGYEQLVQKREEAKTLLKDFDMFYKGKTYQEYMGDKDERE